MRETWQLLEQWGRWSRVGAGLPRTVTPLAAIMPAQLDCRSPVSICDDAALLVDRVVCQLARRDEVLCSALKFYFVDQLSMRDLSARLRVSRHLAEKYLHSAVAWVDCGVFGVSDAA